jgi:ketosteroid isomerase-like protein
VELSPLSPESSRAADRAAIEKRLDSWLSALRAKDVDALLSHYAPDLLVYNLAPPLRTEGLAAPRKSWAEWFAQFDGPIGYEVRDRRISHGADVAFSTSINHIWGLRKDGQGIEIWVRVTVGLCKVDGKWLATHEHVSVPFDMTSLQALLDLRP